MLNAEEMKTFVKNICDALDNNPAEILRVSRMLDHRANAKYAETFGKEEESND